MEHESESSKGDLVLPYKERATPAEWRPYRPNWLSAGRGTFVSGDPESQILRVRYFSSEPFEGVYGRAWFGGGAEGPPRHAHGGTVASVLDEAMGTASWKADLRTLAGRLEVDFVRSVPLGEELHLEAQVESVEGSKVFLESRLELDNVVFARGRGLFVLIDFER